MAPGTPFSNFHRDITFVCSLREDPCHDIEDLWRCRDGYFAYYRYSGLRAITFRLFNELFNKFSLT